MFGFFIFLICIVSAAISAWLANSGRAFENPVKVKAWLLSESFISTRPQASLSQILYGSFMEQLDHFVRFFYGHTNRLRVFRIIAMVLGILPAWSVGIMFLAMNQNIAFALLLLGLGGVIVILLLLEFRISSRGYLDRGGGPSVYPEGVYIGHARLLKKVYTGDSRNITINLLPSVEIPTGDQLPLEVQQDDSGLTLRAQVPLQNKSHSPEYLEFEMLAAGFEVKGDLRQRQLLRSQALNYLWNCYFPNSGEHSYAFLVRRVDDEGSIEIGRIESTVRVVKIDHLTQRQVFFLATIIGVPSSTIVVVNAVKALLEFLKGLGLL